MESENSLERNAHGLKYSEETIDLLLATCGELHPQMVIRLQHGEAHGDERWLHPPKVNEMRAIESNDE
jgi:hypothetical protein